jgi:hypothetical protein
LSKKVGGLEKENQKCVQGKPLVKKVRVRGPDGTFVDQDVAPLQQQQLLLDAHRASSMIG